MNAFEQESSASHLAWAQWLSISLSVGCLLACTGDLSLRNPLGIVLWLLGNGLVAVVRFRAHHVGSAERLWLKTFLWVLGLLSPGLLWWALTTDGDITFRNSQTTVRQHRTLSMDPEEEEIETSQYQTTWLIFEEQVGEIKRRPVQYGEKIGY